MTTVEREHAGQTSAVDARGVPQLSVVLPVYNEGEAVEPVLWAVVATLALGRVRTQARIAQFLAPNCPMHEVSKGGPLRPLPR